MGRLDGRVTATTRDGDPEDVLVRLLVAEGATVLSWPTLVAEGPRDARPLEEAARTLESYDWVAFTSARSVTALVGVAGPYRGTSKTAPRIAAVGEATAAALEARGWRVHTVASGHGASALVDAMAEASDLAGARVLFPASSLARPALEEALRARGAAVHRVEAYHVREMPPDGARVRADLAAGVDVVAFASPSAVRSLSVALGGDLAGALGGTGVAAIGSTTASALRELGVRDLEVAPKPGMDGLVDACVASVNRHAKSARTS